MLTAGDAAALYSLLRRGGIRCWVMGGWGVDALLGRVTRAHKDLDILVLRGDLAVLHRFLEQHGFERKRLWETENRWAQESGLTWPTAFLAADPEGRELDIHVIETGPAAEVTVLCNVPWHLGAGSLDGRGTIAGTPVECVSARTQIRMHEGYPLPPAHVRDLDLLRDLL